MTQPRKGKGAANPGHFDKATGGRDTVPTANALTVPTAATADPAPSLADARAALRAQVAAQDEADKATLEEFAAREVRYETVYFALGHDDADFLGYNRGRASLLDELNADPVVRGPVAEWLRQQAHTWDDYLIEALEDHMDNRDYATRFEPIDAQAVAEMVGDKYDLSGHARNTITVLLSEGFYGTLSDLVGVGKGLAD